MLLACDSRVQRTRVLYPSAQHKMRSLLFSAKFKNPHTLRMAFWEWGFVPLVCHLNHLAYRCFFYTIAHRVRVCRYTVVHNISFLGWLEIVNQDITSRPRLTTKCQVA